MSLFACSSCSCLFSIASRFKGVLGTTRTANVGIGVPVAKAQHPVIVVIGHPTSIPPPNRSYPSSHRKIGISPCHIRCYMPGCGCAAAAVASLARGHGHNATVARPRAGLRLACVIRSMRVAVLSAFGSGWNLGEGKIL